MLAVWLTSFSHGGTKGHEGGNDVLLGVHFDCFFFFGRPRWDGIKGIVCKGTHRMSKKLK